jgi:DNA-binding transcriptional MerR regulator
LEYKISELVALTEVPKSTILYYIREGLLPEAKKIKSNVHRYNDEHLELIKYIKYMQNEIGSSNEQIKLALANKNSSISSSFTMIAPLMQTLLNMPSGSAHHTKDAFIEFYDLDIELVDKLLDDGILLPVSDNDYTEKEASIVRMIENFNEIGIDYDLIKAYVTHAKELALIEQSMQKKLCSVKNEENFSTAWKIMFDTLLNAKDYIFRRYTYKSLHKTIKEEIS